MKSIDLAWLKLLHSILHQGAYCNPRGMASKELIGFSSVVNMNHCILTNSVRNIKHAFLFGEAAWILSGSNRVRDIEPFMKNITKFSDDGITFFGAYGPKVSDQLAYVVDTLINDLDSRQAVINIWREKPAPTKDVPCTLSLQFLVRDNVIHTVVTMRSSDAWLGWVYDVFNFSMITKWVAIALRKRMCNDSRFSNLQLGSLTLTAGSQHLYEHDIPEAKKAVLHVPVASSKYNVNRDLELFSDPDELTDALFSAARFEPHKAFGLNPEK